LAQEGLNLTEAYLLLLFVKISFEPSTVLLGRQQHGSFSCNLSDFEIVIVLSQPVSYIAEALTTV